MEGQPSQKGPCSPGATGAAPHRPRASVGPSNNQPPPAVWRAEGKGSFLRCQAERSLEKGKPRPWGGSHTSISPHLMRRGFEICNGTIGCRKELGTPLFQPWKKDGHLRGHTSCPGPRPSPPDGRGGPAGGQKPTVTSSHRGEGIWDPPRPHLEPGDSCSAPAAAGPSQPSLLRGLLRGLLQGLLRGPCGEAGVGRSVSSLLAGRNHPSRTLTLHVADPHSSQRLPRLFPWSCAPEGRRGPGHTVYGGEKRCSENAGDLPTFPRIKGSGQNFKSVESKPGPLSAIQRKASLCSKLI